MVRDSAGVRIVVNGGPGWTADQAWRVDAEPLLAIDDDFFRVAGATLLSNGALAVGNAGDLSIRVFDPQGHQIGATGRRGRGPGEYDGLQGPWRTSADTLYVYDASHERLSFIDASGKFVRDMAVATPGPMGLRTVRLTEGGAVLIGGVSGGDTFRLVRISDGTELDRVAGSWYQVITLDGGNSSNVSAPFTPRPGWDVFGEVVYFLDQGFADIHAVSLSNGRRTIVRRSEPRIEVTTDLRNEWIERAVMQMPPEAQAYSRDLWNRVAFPDSLPRYARLLTDALGSVWVERWGLFEGSGVWEVFTDDGTLLGSVALPEALRPFEIGSDYVLGVWRDELEVEHLRIHRLQRSASNEGGP
jgi:hypothetical protein